MPRASKTPPRKRPKRTAALSKEKIIKAAIAEFALKGLDGARVDEVARRSGVNKTLLYQYVGNKDHLFTAALEAAYQSIRERQKEFIARQMDPETGVRQLVHLLMSIWVEHQDYGKLLASENFHGGKHVKRSKLIAKQRSRLAGIGHRVIYALPDQLIVLHQTVVWVFREADRRQDERVNDGQL